MEETSRNPEIKLLLCYIALPICNSINYLLISQQNFELHLAHKRNKGKKMEYREATVQKTFKMQVTFHNSSKPGNYFN